MPLARNRDLARAASGGMKILTTSLALNIASPHLGSRYPSASENAITAFYAQGFYHLCG